MKSETQVAFWKTSFFLEDRASRLGSEGGREGGGGVGEVCINNVGIGLPHD